MNPNAIIFDEPPDNFSPGALVSACHLMIDREILLIQRSPTNSEPGKWGVPAGKIESNETTEEAMKRELFEETGLSFPLSSFEKVNTLFIRKPMIDYVYHLFALTPEQKPDIQLSNEHSRFLWVNIEELHGLPLMAGAKESMERFFKLYCSP